MGFENSGLIPIRNNARLRGFYKKPKLLNGDRPKVTRKTYSGKLSLDSDSAFRIKRQRMRKILSFISVIIIAVVLSLYLLDVTLSIF